MAIGAPGATRPMPMPIALRSASLTTPKAIAEEGVFPTTAFDGYAGVSLPIGRDDALDGLALDELLLATPGVAQGGLGEAVEVA